MPDVRKTAKTVVQRNAGLMAPARKAVAAVPKAAAKARAKPSADPTGRVMTRLRGSLGKDYRLDI